MAVAFSPTDLSNADLARSVFDALNRHDVAALKPVWADAVERFPDRTCHGADEIAAYFEEVFAAIADFHMDVRAIAEQGDDVFVHWHLTGTHVGAIQGLEPTGKAIAVDGMDHFVVRDGKIVSNFVVFDQMQYGRQLGLLPPDGSAADKGLKAAFNARTKVARRLARQGRRD